MSHGLEGTLASVVVHFGAGAVTIALVGLRNLSCEFLASISTFLRVSSSSILLSIFFFQLARFTELLSLLAHFGLLLGFAIRFQILRELRLTVSLRITFLLLLGNRLRLSFLEISFELIFDIVEIFE